MSTHYHLLGVRDWGKNTEHWSAFDPRYDSWLDELTRDEAHEELRDIQLSAAPEWDVVFQPWCGHQSRDECRDYLIDITKDEDRKEKPSWVRDHSKLHYWDEQNDE